MESSLSGSQCPRSMWLLIPEEYESRDIFCCHQPITCTMNCHGKFYNLCQSLFSNLRWPSTVETCSLLVFSLCWLLSVSTKLSRLAVRTRGWIFWVLRPLVHCEAWWCRLEWVERKPQVYTVSGSFSHVTPQLWFDWQMSIVDEEAACWILPNDPL